MLPVCMAANGVLAVRGRRAFARKLVVRQSPDALSPASGQKPKPTPEAARRIAPAGVLYLTEDVVVPIQNGLKGIAAGTEVKLVRESGDVLQVTDGGQPFALKKRQATDDLDVVDAIRKRVAADEAANEISRQQQEELLVKQQREQIEFLRTHPLASPTPTPSPTVQR